MRWHRILPVLCPAVVTLSLAYGTAVDASTAGDPMVNASAAYRMCINEAATRLDDGAADPQAIVASADSACTLERVQVMQSAAEPDPGSLEPFDRTARRAEASALIVTAKQLQARRIVFNREQDARGPSGVRL